MATLASPSPFGLLESMLASATVRHLSNATATWWPGGQAVGMAVPGLRVIFDRAAQDGLDHMVSDRNPAATVLDADFPGVRRKDALLIVRDGEPGPGQLFSVLERNPDGTGNVQLDLSEAAP
jgi:hypothetical protein